ncbi:MAG: UDP-glucose 4-epimerase GalE [Planctomycetota bacterium]
MKVLVVGGAGYIGSHTVRKCRRAGIEPVVFDNYSTGNAESVDGIERVTGDLLDPRSLCSVFENFHFDAVFHFAASCSVPESVDKPLLYYRNNVAGSLNLMHAMMEAGVERLIFSSTAAVYGNPTEIPISEDHDTLPVNPYGNSKLLVERTLKDISERHPLRYIALRYFNAAGADLPGDIGEDHREESHLVPLIFHTALGRRRLFKIFGNDYNTPDGTCIRDFIHVNDIARAHILALEKIEEYPNESFNLGTSEGYSVKEVVEESQQVIGMPISVVQCERRPGDPAVLVASNEKARARLGWEPENSDLRTILETAWKWHRTHPRGFEGSSSNLAERESRTTELFGDIAIRLGFVTDADVTRALERQQEEMEQGHQHKLIGMHMLEMGLLSTSQLIEILKYYEDR